MQYVQYYECEFCGRRYRSEEECLEHERDCFANPNKQKVRSNLYTITINLVQKTYVETLTWKHLYKNSDSLLVTSFNEIVKLDEPCIRISEGSTQVYVEYYSLTECKASVFREKCLDAFEGWLVTHLDGLRSHLRKV